MPPLIEPLQTLLNAYQTAVRNKDVAAFAAIYHPDVTVFDFWAKWSYRGIDTWRAMAQDWFASLGDVHVLVEFEDIHTVASDELIVAYLCTTFRGINTASGEELHSMQNRLSWVLQNHEGLWQVIHEHTSGPINPETTRVIFKRAEA